MYDKVITTERAIKNALSKLISNDPYVQLNWVEDNPTIESILDLRSVGEELYAASDIEPEFCENYLPEYLICPIFMLAVVGRTEGAKNTLVKEISHVDFCSSIEELKECVDIIGEGMLRKDIHLFMFKDEEGFVEIPFDMGYYISNGDGEKKEKMINHVGSKLSAKLPYKFICDSNSRLEDSFFRTYDWSIKYCEKLKKAEGDRTLFIDVPGVWEASYIDSALEPMRQVHAVWHSMENFEDVIERVAHIMLVRMVDPDQTFVVEVSNSWYSYRFVAEPMNNEDKSLERVLLSEENDPIIDFVQNLKIYEKPLFY